MSEKLMKELLAELKKNSRLWTLDDLCDYFQVSKRTLADMRKSPDFPSPIGITYIDSKNICRSTDRWEPETIRNYAKRKRVA